MKPLVLKIIKIVLLALALIFGVILIIPNEVKIPEITPAKGAQEEGEENLDIALPELVSEAAVARIFGFVPPPVVTLPPRTPVPVITPTPAPAPVMASWLNFVGRAVRNEDKTFIFIKDTRLNYVMELTFGTKGIDGWTLMEEKASVFILEKDGVKYLVKKK